jgi:carbamoyltransferase
MKVLGINISHHCSFAFFEDGVLKEYYEEDRFNKIKNFEPFWVINQDILITGDETKFDDPYEYQALKKFKDIEFDQVIFASNDRMYMQIELLIIKNFLRQVKYKEWYFNIRHHHLYHAMSGFYFSGFDEALVITCDGGGEHRHSREFDCESLIATINKSNCKIHYKLYSNQRSNYYKCWGPEWSKEHIDHEDGIDHHHTNKLVCGHRYIEYREYTPFGEFQEGQMMGIAAYDGKKTNLDPGVLAIAARAQEETLQERIEAIERAKTYNDKCKNLILSGGYHLNCANNFKLVKHFPEFNFFVDPIPYDGGNAVGAAYLMSNRKNYEDHL